MAVVVFALSLVLILAGLWSGYMSLDLLPTPTGVLYALAGAFAAAISVLAFALGVAIRRIDALATLLQPGAAEAGTAPGEARPIALAPAEEAAAHDASAHDFSAHEPQAALPGAEVELPPEEAERPINENRVGHLPTLGPTGPAPEKAAPPALVGRYSAGGADYTIFSDGSIEAETPEGTFKFASMGEFKRFIAGRGEGHA
ncbi:MAG: hypothetical protein JO288_03410 [Hyphomicrobiales bacterium]|nr:hypothetical protein [Hyphomicrobiales bacterium]